LKAHAVEVTSKGRIDGASVKEKMYGMTYHSPHQPVIWCIYCACQRTKLGKHGNIHYEKKRCFATSLTAQFLNYIKHLQLTIFICYECYRTSCKSCNSLYIWCNSLQFNYNFIVTTPFQLLYNSLMTIIISSCWRYFTSIHQDLTCGTMRIFRDFYEILISIVHYDYSF
jgi:hypothetical protein